MLGHFHHAYMYFCTHVLPAVYDESLSYYEVLCKLCNSMKELWESQKEVIEITKAAENIVNTLWRSTSKKSIKSYRNMRRPIRSIQTSGTPP